MNFSQFIGKRTFVFFSYFCPNPELDFAFIIQRSPKLTVPLIDVNFESSPLCLKSELIGLFGI